VNTVRFRRRSLFGFAAAASAIPARAETILPNKTLRLLVGFQANGGTDIICRQIATQLERRLGRRVVVENKPGGSGGLPGQLVAASPPDGTTLAFLASTTLVAKLGPTEYPFDPQGDLTPVSLAGTWPWPRTSRRRASSASARSRSPSGSASSPAPRRRSRRVTTFKLKPYNR